MAFKLAIPAYFGATVVFAFEFWRYFLVRGLIVITGNDGLIFFLAISMIALVLSLIWF
jgi:hypothetical protein